jgi:hypothetical protein
MNKIQGTLFNFGVKKSRIEGVCDPENKIHPPQNYRAISKMYKRGESYKRTEENVCIHS